MNDDRPLLVFFWSQRSGPARRMESLLAHLERKERDRLRIRRVDVDASPELAERFAVGIVPTLVLVKDKRAVSRLDGRTSAPKIEAHARAVPAGSRRGLKPVLDSSRRAGWKPRRGARPTTEEWRPGMGKLGLSGLVLAAAIALLGLASYAIAGGGNEELERPHPMTGYEENPDVSTVASGSFEARLSGDGDSLAYELSYSGLEGTVTQAHIHFGKPAVNGGISIWLCESGDKPVAVRQYAGLPAGGHRHR